MASSTVARLSAQFRIDGIPAAQAQLRSIDRSMASTAKQGQQSIQSVSKATTGLSSSLKGGVAAAAGFGAGMVGVTAAIKAVEVGLIGSVTAAAQYEKNLNVLRATSGATSTEMAQISATAKTLGADTNLAGVSASTAATAMLELSKSGLSVTDTMGAARGVLQLATAGEISAGEAASIAAAQLNAFSLAGSESGRVADLLAAAANASQTSVQQLGTGMAQASAVFANAGMTVEDLVTSMALMSNRGIQGSDAATSLKTAVLRLQAPTDVAAEAMAALGINVRDAQGNMLPMQQLIAHLTDRFSQLAPAQRDAAMATIFGSDAIRAAQVVFAAGADSFGQMASKVTEAGAAQKLAEAQTQGLAGAWAGLISQAETLQLTVGELATGPLTAMVELASELVGGWTNVLNSWMNLGNAIGDDPGFQRMAEDIRQAVEAVREFITAVGNFETPIGRVRDVLGDLADAYSNLPAPIRMMINPLGEAKAAVDDLTGASTAAVKENQQLADLWGGAAASSGKTYADTLKSMSKEGKSAGEQAEFLRSEHERLTQASTKLWQEVQKEVSAFDGSFTAAQKNSEAFREANAAYVGTTQSLATVNSALGEMGVKAVHTADGTSQLVGQVKELPSAAAGAAGAASAFAAPWEERLEAVRKKADDAYKALRKLIDAPTAEEIGITTQLARVEGVLANVEAGFATTGQAQQTFFSQAQTHAQTAGLQADALERVNTIIGQAKDGTISHAAATAQLEAVLNPHTKTLETVAGAYESTRTAEGAASEQAISNATGTAKAAEDWKQAVENGTQGVIGAYGEVESVIAEKSSSINESASSIAGPDVQSQVQGNVEATGEVFGTGLTDPAQAAIDGANEVLRQIGAGDVQVQVQGNADAIGKVLAPPMEAGATEAVNNVNAKADEIMGPSAMSTAASNTQKVAEAIKNTLGLTNLTPEAQQVINTMAQGLLSGSSAVVANMQAIIGHLRAAANVNLSAEGRQAAASFAAGLMAGISEARVAAAIVASTPVTAVDQHLDMGSPSKVMIQRGEWASQGFAVGLVNAQGEVVAATRQMSEGAITTMEEQVDRFNRILDTGAIDTGLYTAGLADLVSEFTRMSGAIPEVIVPLNQMIPVERQLSNESDRLQLEIARLNRQLKDTEPYSEQAAAIEEQIKILEAWRGKVTDNISILQLEQKVLEQNKTAWDGATEARAKFAQSAADKASFGGTGADVMAGLGEAFKENSPESGAAAAALVDKYLESVREQLGERFPEVADQVWDLFGRALSAPDEAAREGAVNGLRAIFGGIQQEATNAATLTATTFNTALANAQMGRAISEQLGPQFTSLFEQLNTTIAEGGVGNIEKLAEMVDGMSVEMQRLPDFLRGELGTQWSQAWTMLMEEPGNPANIERLQEAARRINQALAVIPEDFAKLEPRMQQVVMDLFRQVDAGTMPLKQAQEKWSAILKLIPQDMANLSPTLQAEINNIIDAFINMGLSAEQAQKMISDAMARAAADAAETARRIAATVATLPKGGGAFIPGAAAGGGGGNPYATLESMMNDQNAGEVMAAIANAYHTQGIVYIQGLGWVKPVQEVDGSVTFEQARRPFSKGGIAYSEVDATLHGSSTNPEVVAPLSRLPDLIGQTGEGAYDNTSMLIHQDFQKLILLFTKLERALSSQKIMIGNQEFARIVNGTLSSYIRERGLPG